MTSPVVGELHDMQGRRPLNTVVEKRAEQYRNVPVDFECEGSEHKEEPEENY